MRYTVPYKGAWQVFTDEDLLAMPSDQAGWLRDLHDRYERNRLSFFLAHGGGLDFLNDYDSDISILTAPNQTGKATSLDTRLKTPHAEVCMGDMKVGTRLVGSNGDPCFVTAVYPQGPKPLFRLCFEHGTADVCAEHQWVANVKDAGFHSCGVYSTEELLRRLNLGLPVHIPVLEGGWSRLLQANPIGVHEAQCITVDSPDHTFTLANGLVTHNSYHGMSWLLLRCVPTHKDWPCFKDNGLKFVPRDRKDILAYCASYDLKILQRAIWPTITELLPDDYLKEYSPRYKGKGKRKVSWRGDASLPLDFGSDGTLRLDFASYSQNQSSVESVRYDFALSDEQMPRPMVVGLIERGRTRGGINIAACATPHKLKGRPDTGMSGWIGQAMVGNEDFGVSMKHYKITMEDVPDAIYSAEEKKKAYREHIEIPTENQDFKRLREGRARYYGEPESSEGCCLDEWDPKIHLIAPFKIPKEWTRFRSCDHANKTPCACLWGAVCPDGDLYLYREYYVKDKTIGEHVKAIVELSGNTLKPMGEYNDKNDIAWPLSTEVMSGESYFASVLDGRSFNTKQGCGLTIGQMYNNFGASFAPASNRLVSDVLPIMNQWLSRDPKRKHKYQDVMGAPKVYVFNTLKYFQMEAQAWVMNDATGKPRRENDHLAGSAFQFMIECGPRYFGPMKTEASVPTKGSNLVIGGVRAKSTSTANSFTGYS